MKKIVSAISVSILLSLFLSGCSSKIDNKITFQNSASNTIYVNFRANRIPVEAGKSVEVTEIPRGEYSYETTYEIPFGTESHTTVGDVSGMVTLDAGTKILIFYSSTFINNIYTLGATMTSSDSGSDPVSP